MPDKLDLLLKGLYEFSHDDDAFISLDIVARRTGIFRAPDFDLKSMVKTLANEGLIDFQDLSFQIVAKLTFEGIIFCEKTSHAFSGYPIITKA